MMFTTEMTNAKTRLDLAKLDLADPLAKKRELFHIPPGLLYFDGNSLGPLPHNVRERLVGVVQQEWAEDLIRSWNLHGWVDLPRQTAAKIARLVGAGAHEVTVTDSTSVNLFKLLAAALELTPERRVILSDSRQFPTDLYMAEGLAALLGRGHELRLVDGDEDALEAALDASNAEKPAVLYLSHVRFKDGRLLDMARLTEAAHRAGATVIWDLSHSTGALPVDLNGCDVDFAVGCGYKFLNGGPGAPAFLYVAERLHDKVQSPLAGWFGHAQPFAFDNHYTPAPGIDRFLCGTAPILSLAALDSALDVFEPDLMPAVREKSIALGDLFIDLVERKELDVRLVSPRDGRERGSQVSFSHPEAYAVTQALIDRSVVPDFRDPDVVRFGLTPLYMQATDVWDAVTVLAEILRSGVWNDERYKRRHKVT